LLGKKFTIRSHPPPWFAFLFSSHCDFIQLYRPVNSHIHVYGYWYVPLFVDITPLLKELLAKRAHIDAPRLVDPPRISDESLAGQKRRQ
jgi:hypothetical protein